jgi:uncharacterized protein (TIGR03382 family)
MYPFEDSRETKKRIPKADDLSAVISTYPLVDDPLLCSEPAVAKASGCSTTARPSGAALPWLGLAATLALLVARRRRAAGSRSSGLPATRD